MNPIDFIILLIVLIILGSIIYYKFIKKQPNKSGCHCYKAKSCSVKLGDLKEIIANQQKEMIE